MMEEKKMTVEDVLKTMEEKLGEEPRAMVLMSKLIPEMIPKHAQDMKFVMELPHIPPKYKQLMMIGITAAVGSRHCTENQIKLARRAGVSKEEIAEALITARFTLAATVVVTATEGMEYLVAE